MDGKLRGSYQETDEKNVTRENLLSRTEQMRDGHTSRSIFFVSRLSVAVLSFSWADVFPAVTSGWKTRTHIESRIEGPIKTLFHRNILLLTHQTSHSSILFSRSFNHPSPISISIIEFLPLLLIMFRTWGSALNVVSQQRNRVDFWWWKVRLKWSSMQVGIQRDIRERIQSAYSWS